ncbi:hypothetical protein MANI_025163 [Metarhizium anisopliae]|nr:hypothetical protein MANI_025163 [Metarhizium anisopliae]
MAPDAPTFRLHLMLFLRRNDMVFFFPLVVFSAQPTPDTVALSPTTKNNRRIFIAPGFDGCCHAGIDRGGAAAALCIRVYASTVLQSHGRGRLGATNATA